MKKSRFTKEQRKEIIKRAKSILPTYNPAYRSMFTAIRYIIKHNRFDNVRNKYNI